MKLQEKRHGPLNSTHDASLDELSEVILYLFETRKTIFFRNNLNRGSFFN